MSFDSYANLLAEFRSWTDRTDRDSQFDSFLRLIEKDVERTLALRAQDQTATGTLTGGSDTLLTPANILYPRLLIFAGSGNRPIIINSVAYEKGLEVGFANAGTATPLVATVHGVDASNKTQIKVFPTPTGNVNYTLHYTSAVTPLTSGANPVTYLLTVHGDVYHFGLQMHNSVYDKDWENAAAWRALYTEAKRQAKAVEWRGRLQLGRFRMRPDVATP